ncbi:MAG: type II/IV secretion system ATPase subunit [archaeon]|nr:type II/IV secretion system ATPase subunit [archaeon]
MPLRGWLRKKIDDIRSDASAYDFSKELDSFYISNFEPFLLFPELPKDITAVDIKYPLIPPFTFASINWNKSENALIYSIIEPQLNERTRKIYNLLDKNLSENINVQLSKLNTRDELFQYLKKNVRYIIIEKGIILKEGEITKIMYYIFRNFVGLNEAEPLLHDNFIEDIGDDGVDVPIFIFHKKMGHIKTSITLNNYDSASSFVVKLAERCGRYISYAEPFLDGSLPDGSRVQATYSKDVTTRGPTFSIRKFSSIPFSVINMINYGTGSIELFAYLWYLIEHQKNFMVCGATSAGKTSLLNALVSFIPPQEKVVSIEDTRELHLLHDNWVPSVTRQSFGAGKEKYGEVSMFDLLKASFRQNPDYVIVGEVRGVEASVLFQGMASGHPSLSTMHAGSVDEIVQRLTTPPISLSAGLVNALDIVIFIQHSARFGINSRRIREIDEVSNVDVANLRVNFGKSFIWQPSTDVFKSQHSLLLETLSIDYGISVSTIHEEIRKRAKLLFWLHKNMIQDFDDVSVYLSKYYSDKETVLKMIKEKTYHTKSGIFTNKAYKEINNETLFSSLMSGIKPASESPSKKASEKVQETPKSNKKTKEVSPDTKAKPPSSLNLPKFKT